MEPGPKAFRGCVRQVAEACRQHEDVRVGLAPYRGATARSDRRHRRARDRRASSGRSPWRSRRRGRSGTPSGQQRRQRARGGARIERWSSGSRARRGRRRSRSERIVCVDDQAVAAAASSSASAARVRRREHRARARATDAQLRDAESARGVGERAQIARASMRPNGAAKPAATISTVARHLPEQALGSCGAGERGKGPRVARAILRLQLRRTRSRRGRACARARRGARQGTRARVRSRRQPRRQARQPQPGDAIGTVARRNAMHTAAERP